MLHSICQLPISKQITFFSSHLATAALVFWKGANRKCDEPHVHHWKILSSNPFHQSKKHFVSIYPCLLQISPKFIGAKQFLRRHPLSPSISRKFVCATDHKECNLVPRPERVFCTRQKIPSLTLCAQSKVQFVPGTLSG